MSAILFPITPKVYVPLQSYNFSNPEPLGADMKNLACSRLVTMLYLEIQKGGESMKTSTFKKDIGGTAACKKRLIMDTKGCDN